MVKVVMKEMMNWCEKDGYKQAHIVIACCAYCAYCLFFISVYFCYVCCMYYFSFSSFDYHFLVNKDV